MRAVRVRKLKALFKVLPKNIEITWKQFKRRWVRPHAR